MECFGLFYHKLQALAYLTAYNPQLVPVLHYIATYNIT